MVGEFGARLHEVWVPDGRGDQVDVLLGFDTDAEDRLHIDSYVGAMLGRVSGRIKDAEFDLDGQRYALSANQAPSHLHGGATRSFDRVRWTSRPDTVDEHPGVRFAYLSRHLEEGYPGQLTATVTYAVVDLDLWLIVSAETTAPTPVSLTSHAFWNLAGHGSGTVLDHELQIPGAAVALTDDDLVPTGALRSVERTALDFRTPRSIGARIAELDEEPAAGYDHCYVLDGEAGLRRAAILRHPESGRTMEVLTTEPALQLYSANRLPLIPGKGGTRYGPRSAICLEPQIVPNAINRDNGRGVVLRPGQTYRHTLVFRFGSEKR